MPDDAFDLRRRAVVAASFGTVAVGLGLAGCRGGTGEKGGSDRAGEEVTANEDLMREHGVLRRVLILYREVAPRIAADAARVDAGALARAAGLFRDFGERYHEQMLEEQHVFPRVRSAGGEGALIVDMLIAQHARGREITAYVLDRTRTGKIGVRDAAPLSGAMLAFARMYEAHAAREDTIVFPAFRKALGKQYDELGEQFEAIERREFGEDGFDAALRTVTDIERTFGIGDLRTFTAPPP